MKIRTIVAAVTLALASSTAFAWSCPRDMKAIDEALAKNPKLTDAQMAEVKKLRADGEKFHKASPHKSRAPDDDKEAIDALAKAKKILGI